MDRKSKLIHAAGRSYAAKEMRQYFGFDQWESDPEIRKDEIDFTLAASDLRNADGELPQLVHPAYTLDLCGTWQLSSPSAPGRGGWSRLRCGRPDPGGGTGQRAYGLYGAGNIKGSLCRTQ